MPAAALPRPQVLVAVQPAVVVEDPVSEEPLTAVVTVLVCVASPVVAVVVLAPVPVAAAVQLVVPEMVVPVPVLVMVLFLHTAAPQ